ncbi:MAG: RNA polymerase sigma factor [Lachnospiraceae bacterium]
MERFMELYESVYRDLYHLAFYYMGNQQDAEDAVSETVLKAYENFGTLRNEKAFKAWIFRILVNQCKSQLSKNSVKGTMELMEEPVYHPELADLMITRDLLSGLSQEERKIVTLSVFGGYKGAEIARILNRRHSTIRSRYRRALKKLEKQILDEEVQHERS